MKRLILLLTVLAICREISAEAGLVLVDPTEPADRRVRLPTPEPRPPVLSPVELHAAEYRVKIHDQIATITLEQELYNPNSRPSEAVLLFPLPKDAKIDRFSMDINGKPVDGELLSADKARGIYEDIVRKQKDPGLLEFAGRGLIRIRIFPIEPNAKKQLRLAYTQLLKSDSGLVGLMVPLSGEKSSASFGTRLRIDLETSQELKTLYSPTHVVDVDRQGPRKASITLRESKGAQAARDFQLFFNQEDGALGARLAGFRRQGEEGYFALLATPSLDASSRASVPKDVVFVLDTSGSMAGEKLDQAKKALLFCVENLNEGDRFNILRFATEVEPAFVSLSEVDAGRRAVARNFIRDLKPLGGTAIEAALRKALSLRTEGSTRPFIVVFMTDGLPTVGVTDESQILAAVAKERQGLTRVFCFGLGTDVNTHLLDKIAEESNAASQYVLPQEDIEIKVSQFFSKIKDPVLSALKIRFPDGIRVTRHYPAALPDLFRGDQLVLVGRYAEGGRGKIEISGEVNGEPKTFSFDVSFPSEATEHEFLPQLWATRRVGYLLDEIRLRGDNSELKEEITELARRYGIVTPYTAYLILEDERRREVPVSLRAVQGSWNSEERDRLSSHYRKSTGDKDGAAAVAGARSFSALKQAEAPADAIVAGNAGSPYPASAPSVSAQSRLSSSGNPADRSRPGGAIGTPAPRAAAPEGARVDAGVSMGRHVGGRTFFHNGTVWVDSQVQAAGKLARVRIAFGSDEYFNLISKHPQSAAWLALGREVQFVLEDKVYEIHE